jgi:hypothetical protein
MGGSSGRSLAQSRFCRYSPPYSATLTLERWRSRSYYPPDGNGMKRRAVCTAVVRLRVDERSVPLRYPELQQRIKDMKHLLSGVAIVAALAIAAPASAQRTGPGAGAPGPNQPVPGGPGPSSPLSNLPPSPSRDTPYPPPPPAATAPGSPGMSSAMPPEHRHARSAKGKMAARSTSGGRAVRPDNSANQLNADELSRLQAGNYASPPSSALPYGQPPQR